MSVEFPCADIVRKAGSSQSGHPTTFRGSNARLPAYAPGRLSSPHGGWKDKRHGISCGSSWRRTGCECCRSDQPSMQRPFSFLSVVTPCEGRATAVRRKDAAGRPTPVPFLMRLLSSGRYWNEAHPSPGPDRGLSDALLRAPMSNFNAVVLLMQGTRRQRGFSTPRRRALPTPATPARAGRRSDGECAPVSRDTRAGRLPCRPPGSSPNAVERTDGR